LIELKTTSMARGTAPRSFSPEVWPWIEYLLGQRGYDVTTHDLPELLTP
jgi:hypothetical protein